jgi:hypothetical protein
MSSIDEKNTQVVDKSSSPSSDDGQVESSRDWTAQEERKAKWKLDLLIMPILTLGFFCLRKESVQIQPRVPLD